VIFRVDYSSLIKGFKVYLKEKSMKQKYIDDLEDEDMLGYFKKLFAVCLHMKLNDPEIIIQLSLALEEKYNR
jgi:hypothetical protein